MVFNLNEQTAFASYGYKKFAMTVGLTTIKTAVMRESL
jgi:hypothetical protein